LGLPHGKSFEVAEELASASPGSILVDLGADHRLENSQDWEDYYGGPHPGTWTYGMPELVTGWSKGGTTGGPIPKQRAALRGATRIAVPGCNVTAVTLALAPGIASGMLAAGDLVAVLANGVSGAGKSPAPHLLASEILGAASAYQVGGTHRHIPEILQNLRRGAAPGAGEPSISFTPTLVPMSRGILATTTALPGPSFDASDLARPWLQAYADERFVNLEPGGKWPSTAQTLGANTAAIQVAFDRKAGRVVVVAAIDNLVKGTAGAAVQSINLALGLPEDTGLQLNGVAP
jgi:N-acetyl-gamma-glutamyl-phosphate reductase